MLPEETIKHEFEKFLFSVKNELGHKVSQINFRDNFFHIITKDEQTNEHEGYRIYFRRQ